MTNRPRFGREYLLAEFQQIGTRLQTSVNAYLVGGGAMSLRNLKDTTKDIDLVVTAEDEYSRLLAVLDELGYEEITDLGEEYQQLGARLCVENDDGCRIDLFNQQIANKLLFSEGMEERSETLQTHRQLHVELAALEDIFLFKTVALRPDDIDDMNTLVQTQLDFEVIEREIGEQATLLGGERFTTYMFQSLAELGERHGVQTPLEETVNEYNEQYMQGYAVRMELAEEDPTPVDTLAKNLDIDTAELEARLDYLEQYDAIKRTEDGILDTGEHDIFKR